MLYDYNNHKLVGINRDEINMLLDFRDLRHPEIQVPISKYGRLNAINTGRLLNTLAELYFKEVLKAI